MTWSWNLKQTIKSIYFCHDNLDLWISCDTYDRVILKIVCLENVHFSSVFLEKRKKEKKIRTVLSSSSLALSNIISLFHLTVFI